MNVQGLTRNNVASHLQVINILLSVLSLFYFRVGCFLGDKKPLIRANNLQRLRWQKYRLNSNKKARTPHEIQEDFGWPNAGTNTALAVSNPLLNSSNNLHAIGSYQAAINAPIQYSSSSYLPMNNNNNFITNTLPYFENFQQPQQQQYYSSRPLPSVLTKQELGHMSSAMENSGQLIYNKSLPYDHNEYFPPAGFSFDQIGRFDSPT